MGGDLARRAIYKVDTADSTFLDLPARTLSRPAWLAALEQAKACLGPGLRGRAVQKVKLKKGMQELEVSPHVHIRTSLWDSMPPTHESRVAKMEAGRKRLAPFHEFMVRRAEQSASA